MVVKIEISEKKPGLYMMRMRKMKKCSSIKVNYKTDTHYNAIILMYHNFRKAKTIINKVFV